MYHILTAATNERGLPFLMKFFHSLWDDPGGAVAKEGSCWPLGLSPDYRHECGICDRDYMLRRGCPCCRD